MNSNFLYESSESSQDVRMDKDLKVTPKKGFTKQNLIDALNKIENYKEYTTNLRSVDPFLNKALEIYYGNMDEKGTKIFPAAKANLEKKRGEKFPVKTLANMLAFIKDYYGTSSSTKDEVNILKYKETADALIFPKDGNPSRKTIENILKTVLGSAQVKYSTEEVSSIDESIIKLKKLLKEEIRKVIIH